jgi:taurine dioxygenase
VTDPTFSCRYRWSEGTYALWDNRCTIHRVASDFIGERVIQRVTVAGEPLVPVR